MKEELAAGKTPLALARVVPNSGFFNEACQAYGGCDYLTLCKTQHPQRWLNDYTVRVWDPRNPDREEK
jgi:hypothetical protein